LQDVRSDRATILWTTLDGAGAGEVRYSQDASFAIKVASTVTSFAPADTDVPYPFWLHRAVLTGLIPNTLYRYRVYVDGVNLTPAASPDSELSFRTASGGATFRFLALGDSGDGQPVQQTLAREMESDTPALVLHVGDLAYEDGKFLELEDYFFDVYRRMLARLPFFPVPGNHDYQYKQAMAYRSMLAVPTDGVPLQDRGLYYSFDWGPVHFTALDSNLPLLLASQHQGPMLDWLEQDLKSTRAQWRVVYFHHTPFATGHHLGDPQCIMALNLITPILEKYSVHLVLNGHEHVYQRTKPRRNGVFVDSGWGTVYITTGGGGFALHEAGTAPFVVVGISASHYMRVDVSGAQMTVSAIGLDGTAIDQFTLSAATALDAVGDAATMGPRLAPGGLFTIMGKDLARDAALIGPVPLSNQLGGVAVTVDGTPAPLLYVSRTQINAQLPYDVTGDRALSVSGLNGAAEMAIKINDVAPAIFSVQSSGQLLGAVIHQDGRLVSDSAPAAPGEWLSIFLTGLGATKTSIDAGQPAPLTSLITVRANVRVVLGSVECEMGFAGLAPGLVGVNQVNFRVPDRATGGLPLQVLAGQVASNSVQLVVK
jgi:uncharacterized protein (TIGR03437 family)